MPVQAPQLGDQKQGKVLVDGFWEYTQGDNSVVILLYGVCTVVLCLLFVYLWTVSLKSAYKAECLAREQGKAPSWATICVS